MPELPQPNWIANDTFDTEGLKDSPHHMLY
jgi:hypothetical protein